MRVLTIIFLTLFSLQTLALEIHFEVDSTFEGVMKSDVEEAIQKLNYALSDKRLWAAIEGIEEYTCLTPPYENPQNIIELLKERVIDIPLGTYWYWKKKVIAKTLNGKIYLNRKNKKRSIKAWSATLFHESLHVLGIGHCGKNDVSKYPYIKQSIPYQWAEILSQFMN